MKGNDQIVKAVVQQFRDRYNNEDASIKRWLINKGVPTETINKALAK